MLREQFSTRLATSSRPTVSYQLSSLGNPGQTVQVGHAAVHSLENNHHVVCPSVGVHMLTE
jgi:hypothetical protein